MSDIKRVNQLLEKAIQEAKPRAYRIKEAQAEWEKSFEAYLDVKDVLEKHSLTVFSGAQELKMFLLNDAKHALDLLVELVKDEQR